MAGRASRGPAWFDHLAAEWREKVDRATEDWDQALSAVRRPLAISEDVAPEEGRWATGLSCRRQRQEGRHLGVCWLLHQLPACLSPSALWVFISRFLGLRTLAGWLVVGAESQP